MINALVAQWIEQKVSNLLVGGPIPSERTSNDAPIAQLVEQIPLKDMVGGSNPSGCTGKKFNIKNSEIFRGVAIV